ncbi:hypothetical protein DEO72_LG7g1545 [Vigna unguiculata]|uniref:Uncharacterized protein n=1 Tax=Vigna unguiculata TaxID=3917 RepID=A0A4D6L1Q1_VIGUN|nr:hypothetical protein DEO72_LG2g2732 [Vigna unguiculata]QCE00257.1 hypothetical protein DEO72_LG7g1545 [Vigna unguiculata]
MVVQWCGNDGALLWLCARKKMAEQGSDLQCAFLVLARGCAEKMEAALLDGRWCVAVAAMLQVLVARGGCGAMEEEGGAVRGGSAVSGELTVEGAVVVGEVGGGGCVEGGHGG